MAKEISMDERIRIGSRSSEAYISAILWSLNNYGFALVEGLGARSGKVLKIVKELREIDNIEVGSPYQITVKGTSGLAAEARKGEERTDTEGGPP